MTTLTVKILRESLAQLGSGHDDSVVTVWLPGSRIDLEATLILREGGIMIEGNVREGSALALPANPGFGSLVEK